MLKFWKYGKYMKKLRIKQTSVLFCKYLSTKASIFMKFETFIHEIVTNDQVIFHKDPCTHVHTQGVNVHERVSSRQNARAQVYASCGRVYAQIFTKNHLIILYYFMNKSLKFHKDLSFCCWDICKIILTFIYS